MSRTAIETKDVPKYVRDLVSRSTTLNEPYMVKFYGKHKVGGEVGFLRSIDRLIKWCKRYYADARVVESGIWYDKYTNARKAYKGNHHNYMVLEITDPIMHRWEKDGFYKNDTI